jgi:hypothetical protein
VALALPDLGPGSAAPGASSRARRASSASRDPRGVPGNDVDAAGWRGPLRLWRTPAVTVLVALTAWESDGAAGAFAEAYARLLPKKHGLPASADPMWQAGGRAFGVERRGRDVLLFEQVPAAALEAVRQAVWRAGPRT